MPIYAGIGSRETPSDILSLMTAYATHMADNNWYLASGGASGADSAFEAGVRASSNPTHMNIWRPSDAHLSHLIHAAQFHPAWDRCSSYTKHLHARNSIIILGDLLDSPVHHIICWTPGATISGGTGQALRIAAAHSIPVYNLARPTILQSLRIKLDPAADHACPALED